MKVIVGIPARMSASRFPGKPLAKILGMTMIEHVYKRCTLARGVDDIFVATCDDEIYAEVSRFGGKALMTKPEIPRAGLRVAEACKQLLISDDDVIVVAQGDEPLLHPEMIEQAVSPLLNEDDVLMGSLVADASESEWLDENEVKVVTDLRGNIIYMSRAAIPTNTRNRDTPRLKQLGIMPYRKKMLLEFQQLPPTPLEIAESVELLRAVEHGIKVRAIKTNHPNISVDTEQDRGEAELAMKNDPIYPQYAGGSLGGRHS